MCTSAEAHSLDPLLSIHLNTWHVFQDVWRAHQGGLHCIFQIQIKTPTLLSLYSFHCPAIIFLLTCRYPNTTRKVLEGVSIAVTLNSRVAVIGANGAGKSTMIKLLTGELETAEGTVWKHPNLRVAYVAQHAFHHIEQHLDKTPNDYIAWRYASGEDREAQEKASAQVCALLSTQPCESCVSCSALH